MMKVSPMLCGEGDPSFFDRPGYILQEKYDGTRCILIKRGSDVALIGRSNKNDFASRFPEIVNDALRIKGDYVIDGEIAFFRGDKCVFVTALATPELKRAYTVKFMAFDVLDIAGHATTHLPLGQRLGLLKKLADGLKTIEVVYTHTNPAKYNDIFEGVLRAGGEGVVVKHIDSPYVEESRAHWFKVKKLHTEECVVCGITEGKGARASTFGALILGQYVNGKIRFVSKCSGFDHATLSLLYNQIMAMPSVPNYIGTDIPNVIKFVPPKIVVEVVCMEKTPNGMLRHPRFIRIRTDKLPTQCTTSMRRKK